MAAETTLLNIFDLAYDTTISVIAREAIAHIAITLQLFYEQSAVLDASKSRSMLRDGLN
jgi:hypothetical protein